MTIPDYALTSAGRQFSPSEHARRLESDDRIVREEVTEAGARVVALVQIPPTYPTTRNW